MLPRLQNSQVKSWRLTCRPTHAAVGRDYHGIPEECAGEAPSGRSCYAGAWHVPLSEHKILHLFLSVLTDPWPRMDHVTDRHRAPITRIHLEND